MFIMRTEFSIVLLQFLVVLPHISTAKARRDVFCDNNKNVLKCEDDKIICISWISTGQNICPLVSLPALPKVNYCNNTVVKNYIFKKCNGEKKKCVAFLRTREISGHCDKALKYVKLHYTCVSSFSECPTLALPTHPIVMMASKKNFSDQISPTKTAKTLEINEQKKSTSTLQLNEIPAKTSLKPGNEKSSHHPVTNPGLHVFTRSTRSRSLDNYTPASLHNTCNAPPHNSATTNNLTSQTPTMNKNNPSLWPKVLVDDKQNEQTDNVPVTKRQSKKMPDSRASSGYYSNNTSPLVEYPANITSSQNSNKKAEQKLPRQGLQRQMSLNSDDDLPPLPPPPPPLIPISPLPHMCVSGYRERKTKNENILDKNLSRPPAIRKVHFKSSE